MTEEIDIERSSKRTHLLLPKLEINRDDPDYAIRVLDDSTMIGGGFSTCLTTEVREKSGLTYDVYSGFSPIQAHEPFMANLQTRAGLSEGLLKLSASAVEFCDTPLGYLKTFRKHS